MVVQYNPGGATGIGHATKLLYEANADTNAYTDAEKTKLAGVQAGATANATDAQLRDRATHTGAQAIGTVTGLQTALDGKQPLAAALTGTTASFTTALEAKLSGVEAGAQVNVGTDLGYNAATRLLTSSTGAAVALPVFSPTDAGLASASGGGTTNFLRADGTWAAPQGSGGVQNNFTATSNPAVTNDSSGGFAAGSRWLNTITGVMWHCVDASVGAAVWSDILDGSSGDVISSKATPVGADKTLLFDSAAADAPVTSTLTQVIDALGLAKKAVAPNAQTGTTYTLVLTDQAVTMDNASANTLTVPANAAVAFPVGSIVNVVQKGAGATTITGDTGVTVNGASAGSVSIAAQWQGVSLWKVAADEWIVSGALA